MAKAEEGAEQTRAEITPVPAAAASLSAPENASERTVGLLSVARRSTGIATVLLARSRSPIYRPETRAALAVAACEHTARAERACHEVLELIAKSEDERASSSAEEDRAPPGGSRTSRELLAALEKATRIGAEVDRERSGAVARESAPLPEDGWSGTIAALAARLREELHPPHST